MLMISIDYACFLLAFCVQNIAAMSAAVATTTTATPVVDAVAPLFLAVVPAAVPLPPAGAVVGAAPPAATQHTPFAVDAAVVPLVSDSVPDDVPLASVADAPISIVAAFDEQTNLIFAFSVAFAMSVASAAIASVYSEPPSVVENKPPPHEYTVPAAKPVGMSMPDNVFDLTTPAAVTALYV